MTRAKLTLFRPAPEEAPEPRRLGYARASAESQALDVEVESLRAAGASHVFRERASAAPSERTQLLRLLKEVQPGDVVLVTRLSCLARSTRDLLKVLTTLAAKGAAFRSLGESWADTTTHQGRLMPTVLTGLAEFEREVSRARSGKREARDGGTGRRMGRPPKLTRHQQREARARRLAGETTTSIARSYAVHHATISRLCADLSDLPVDLAPSLSTQRAAE